MFYFILPLSQLTVGQPKILWWNAAKKIKENNADKDFVIKKKSILKFHTWFSDIFQNSDKIYLDFISNELYFSWSSPYIWHNEVLWFLYGGECIVSIIRDANWNIKKIIK